MLKGAVVCYCCRVAVITVNSKMLRRSGGDWC